MIIGSFEDMKVGEILSGIVDDKLIFHEIPFMVIKISNYEEWLKEAIEYGTLGPLNHIPGAKYYEVSVD